MIWASPGWRGPLAQHREPASRRCGSVRAGSPPSDVLAKGAGASGKTACARRRCGPANIRSNADRSRQYPKPRHPPRCRSVAQQLVAFGGADGSRPDRSRRRHTCLSVFPPFRRRSGGRRGGSSAMPATMRRPTSTSSRPLLLVVEKEQRPGALDDDATLTQYATRSIPTASGPRLYYRHFELGPDSVGPRQLRGWGRGIPTALRCFSAPKPPRAPITPGRFAVRPGA